MRILHLLTLCCFSCLAQEQYQQQAAFGIESTINTDTLKYAITGTMNPEAMKAGMVLLDEGGTAVDAALSVALSQITATGGKFISFAGIFNMVYYEAKTGKIYNLNSSFNTVQEETNPGSIPYVDYSLPANDTLVSTGRTVLVPGFMKGVGAAHTKFGKLPFEKITAHAIELAEDGLPWTQGDAWFFGLNSKRLSRHPETKAIFTNKRGTFYTRGEIFKQPKLAQTLRNINRHGTDYMYTGRWAKKFVRTVRKAGGKMTMRDMKEYEVIWSEPVHGKYHQYDIYTHGKPAIGGAMLLERLNVLEASGLINSWTDLESPESLYQLYLVSTFPSNNYLSFDSSILTKQHAVKKWQHLSRENLLPDNEKEEYKNDHSAGIVATDRWGNMAAIIHSINTVNWGSNGLFVAGVSIPDPAAFQQYKLNYTKPGSRLPEETCPGIVFSNGKPILGFSCVGRGLINQSFLSLVNVIYFHLTPQQVNEGPNIGGPFRKDGKTLLFIEPGKFSPRAIEKAEDMGASFEESNTVLGRFWSGVLRNHETGEVITTVTKD